MSVLRLYPIIYDSNIGVNLRSNTKLGISTLCGARVVTLYNWTLIAKSYVTMLVIKNGHQKDTCRNEIGLYVQNVDTILGWIVTTFGRVLEIV